MVHEVSDVIGQDVPRLLGYMQEAMTIVGTLHDDLTNWLSRYQMVPMALGEATLSPGRTTYSLDVIDLEEGSSPSSRAVQRVASPPAVLVTSLYKVEEVPVGSQQGAELEQFITEMTLGAQWLVSSATLQSDAIMVEWMEGLLTFAHTGCRAEFERCFECAGWPDTESLAMLEAWCLTEGVGETQMVPHNRRQLQLRL